jgi:hypothetical protein
MKNVPYLRKKSQSFKITRYIIIKVFEICAKFKYFVRMLLTTGLLYFNGASKPEASKAKPLCLVN